MPPRKAAGGKKNNRRKKNYDDNADGWYPAQDFRENDDSNILDCQFPKKPNKKTRKNEDLTKGSQNQQKNILIVRNNSGSQSFQRLNSLNAGYQDPPFDDEFEQQDESKLELPLWMQDKYIRDKNGRRPGEENYDPTTIAIPPEEMLLASNAFKQYLEVKSNNWDKLVAFKKWKFYYFYYKDALVVKKVCDLPIQSNKSKQFFCMIHENAFSKFAPILIQNDHKIVLVEQMEEINGKEADHVKREVCQILTKGTYFEYNEMGYASQYLLCLIEDKSTRDFGVVFLDTTTHEFHLGEFRDDPYFTNLRTLLTRIKPVEIVHLSRNLSSECHKMINGLVNKPMITTLAISGYPKRLEEIIFTIKPFFLDKESKKFKLPQYLEQINISVENYLKTIQSTEIEDAIDAQKRSPFFYTLQVLGVSLEYLKNILLADTVFTMGNFLPYDLTLEKQGTLYLDAQALESLEILDISYDQRLNQKLSLFGFMDRTVTPFGKRMFKRWITSPAIDPEKINERLDSIEDLKANPQVLDYMQEYLRRLPDIERTVSRVYNMSSKKRMSPSYFEDFAKLRLKDFVKFLQELKKVEDTIEAFEELTINFKSKRLIQLCSIKEVDIQAFKSKKNSKKNKNYEGLFPRIRNIIEDIEKMIMVEGDHVLPAKGVNKEIDRLNEKMSYIKAELDEILQEYKKRMNSQEIAYVHSRHPYEMEFPEYLVEGSRRPKELLLTSKRQGYIRFRTMEIEDLVLQLSALEGEYRKALIQFVVDLFKQFYERNAYWQQVISCLGELDCLCSLAQLAIEMNFNCRPEVLPLGKGSTFELKGMVHPCLARENPKFVANDILFNSPENIFLITGPNMGGKSTLLRQACIAIIMAQVGSFLPAQSFKLNAIDRIFTRIGATDRLQEGKSTFFVEMEETYTIVNEASPYSFLIIDELGRGTSTYDGVAISYATLKYLTEKTQCLTMFATHYHLLVQEFHMYKNISTYHMASEFDERKDHLKFLYKFCKGEANRSHGIMIGKIAGLPDDVIEKAKEKAEFMTKEKRNISFEKSLMDKFNKAFDELLQIEDKEELFDEDSALVEEIFQELHQI